MWKQHEEDLVRELIRQFPRRSRTKIWDALKNRGVHKTLYAVGKKVERICKGQVTKAVKAQVKVESGVIHKNLSLLPDITKVFALYDSHYPHTIDINPLCDFLKDFKPDLFILGGDNWSCDVVSRHMSEHDILNEGRFVIRDRLLNEAKGFGEQLDKFRAAVGKDCQFHYIIGNHEIWLRDFEAKYPSFTRSEGLDIGHLLKLRERDIRVVEFGGTLAVGKLHFKHGHEFGTQNAPKQAVERCQASVVFGHHHCYKVWPTFSMVDALDKKVAIQVPCYCDLAPMYLERRGFVNSWQNGFFTALVKKSGNFTPYVTLVSKKGHFMVQSGKEYT